MTKFFEVRQKGATFLINFIAILKASIISFGVGILDISETGITFGSININKIISDNIGNLGYKDLEVEKVKNNGNANKRNQTVYAGLTENTKSIANGFGKVSDGLNCLMAFFFILGFKT